MPQFLTTTDPDFEARFTALLGAKREDSPDVDDVVAGIIADVRARGDVAVLELTAKFDRLELTPETLRFSAAEIAAECAKVSAEDKAALELAAARIRAYHARQMPQDAQWTDEAGATLGWRWTPVSAAGLYVPGGLASYPSSVLMNAIPAKVAGVERLAIVVPTPDGVVNPLVLLAARIAGVDEIYRIGGAQAVGALAYGTETIAPVDKITGPGNAFVAAAKRRVFGKVGIDMIAGPSEILVIADRDNDPDWIALDLLSQAEHDESAQSILITMMRVLGRRWRRRWTNGWKRWNGAPSLAQAGAISARSSRCKTWMRPSGSRTGSHPSTWNSAPPRPMRWRKRSPMPVRSSSGVGHPKQLAITLADQTTCCPPPGRHGFQAGCQ